MKLDQIPTRRKPVNKTVYARLFNKAKPRKQRASAAAANPDESEGSGINIARALSIIFAIHILAIGMIFIHKQYLSGRTSAPDATKAAVSTKTSAASSSQQTSSQLPMLSSGDKPYMVKKGDNYAIIAAKFQVDENELRNINRSADIRAGAVLRIPKSKRIVAVEPPEVNAIRNQQTSNSSESGLVEILPPVDQATTKLVSPNSNQNQVSGSKTHTVKSGENIWRISNTYKVSQKELMSINKITDPTKLRIGQVLRIP